MTRFFKILLVVVVLGLILAGCNEKQKTATGEKISDKELNGKTEKQKAVLMKDLDKKYENPKAHYELGKLYHSQGLWDKAEWEYNKRPAFARRHHEAPAPI